MKIGVLILLFFFADGILYSQTADEFINRGIFKFNDGNDSGAIHEFNKALEIDSNNALAYFNRGKAKAEIDDDYRGAILDYNKALE